VTAGVATSDPRATDAAAAVLEAGGNAVDAAVTATFVLFVVEPQSCGVAGDAFAFVAGPSIAPVAYDGSGAIPAALTAAQLAADGLAGIPPRGGRTATVPGALDLLATLLARHGTRPWSEVIGPALALARDGFAVRPSLATAARRAAGEIGPDPVLGPLYVPGGSPVAEGDVVRNPALAGCLAAIDAGGAGILYRGPLAAALVRAVQDDGGYLTVEDLAAHQTVEATAQHVAFRGARVWELPLPTQGPAVLHALALLETGDALGGEVDWAAVLDATRAGMVAAGFDPATMGPRPAPAKGDTTYLAVVDRDGLAVSLITSVFGDFGSHLGVPELGGPVHNRATTLRMLHRSPSPGKPPHTTIPALVTRRDGSPQLCLGVAGGIMQPQTQVQVLIRVLCEDMPLQAAIDAPRFKICFGGDVALEPGHPLSDSMAPALQKDPGPEGFGSAQVVGWRHGVLDAGADARRGGFARLLP
jgi:gamma-glutamyltranspeptidase/glutathione hydrolase